MLVVENALKNDPAKFAAIQNSRPGQSTEPIATILDVGASIKTAISQSHPARPAHNSDHGITYHVSRNPHHAMKLCHEKRRNYTNTTPLVVSFCASSWPVFLTHHALVPRSQAKATTHHVSRTMTTAILGILGRRSSRSLSGSGSAPQPEAKTRTTNMKTTVKPSPKKLSAMMKLLANRSLDADLDKLRSLQSNRSGQNRPSTLKQSSHS